MRSHTSYAALAAVLTPLASGNPFVARDNGTMVYSFTDLTPSAELSWTPCFENFTCAVLEVPLDYEDNSAGTVNLGIIKKPGATPDAPEILVNPGGPGGSSVAQVLQDHESVTRKTGDQFALVGIDPRGVNNSGPPSTCFEGYPYPVKNAVLVTALQVPDPTSDYSLAQTYAHYGSLGQWCTGALSINGTAKYVNTVSTAQDMIHYIELSAKASGKAPEEAKLHYYGISYGSVLGGTLASLFPDRIERMIIDGTLDLEDHYNGGWESSPADMDEAMRYYFKRCFEAGPELCLFHQNATSWEQLEGRYNAILENLKDNPVILGNATSEESQAIPANPTIFTWRDLLRSVFGISYFPDQFPSLDLMLVELETGVVDTLNIVAQSAQLASPMTAVHDEREARYLINCMDSNQRFNKTNTFDGFKAFIRDLEKTSKFGGINAAHYSGPVCRLLDLAPPESQVFDGIPSGNGTAKPILFVNMKFDPVTPLRSAKKYQGLFPGSGLIVANNSGHTAHFQKIKCLEDYTKQYMIDASLPPPDTICEVDEPNPYIAAAKALKENPEAQPTSTPST